MLNEDLKDLLNEKGELPSVVIGGYTSNYIVNGYSLVCSDCANSLLDIEEAEVTHMYIHYEGSDTYCEKCNCTIVSEYGDRER